MSVVEQPGEPPPLRQLWLVIGAAVLAVVTFAGVVGRTIATRWRGIVLTHIFFLTLWLALQVFLFTKDGFVYLQKNIPLWFQKMPQLPAPSALIPSLKVPPSGPPTNCWRDRSLDGNCFARTESHRRPEPPRWRIPDRPPFPCRRFYMCGADDI